MDRGIGRDKLEEERVRLREDHNKNRKKDNYVMRSSLHFTSPLNLLFLCFFFPPFLATVRSELKRYAAALILEKIARAQPQHMQPYMPRVFVSIFLVIHEQRVREGVLDKLGK